MALINPIVRPMRILRTKQPYLKAHYFPEFMAATMTSFMQNMDKLTYYINACKKHNVQVLGPDVNHSLRSFAVQGDAIRFGLGGIKNVGDNAIDRLIAET